MWMQTIKRLIKGSLSHFGYRLVKESLPSDNQISVETQLGRRSVEFIGPPAVGKSTLYFETATQGKFWYTSAEFLQELSGIDFNVFRDTQFDSEHFYQTLAQLKLEEITNNSFSPFDKLRVFQYFYTVLLEDKLFMQHGRNRVIVNQDGLIHNFSENILRLLESDSTLDSYLNDRAIIFCFAGPEIVAERILLRYEEKGTILPQHKNKSFSTLVADQQAQDENFRKLVALLKRKNVPLLEVDTSEKKTENVSKTLGFIRALQSNN